MLVKRLKMQNFRQYKGITTIDFSFNSEKNVTVILGDNACGKTTLLQAFNWCFYGRVTFDKPEELLNCELSETMDKNDQQVVEVEITVLHNNTEFVITRSQRYTNDNGTVRGDTPHVVVSYKQRDGQTKPVKDNEIRKAIDNILPEDLSTYFFFDAEHINRISSSKDLGNAVKKLLGLSAVESTIKHIGSAGKKNTVIGKYHISMISGEKAQEYLTKLQSAEESLEQIKSQLDNYEQEINRYTKRIEELNRELGERQATSRLQSIREKLEKAKNNYQQNLKDSTKEFFKTFSEGSLSFFAQPLLDKVRNFLEETDVKDEGIPDLTRFTIQQLISRGRCICGQEIKDGNDAYQHLIEELRNVPTEPVGFPLNRFRDILENLSSSSRGFTEKISKNYGEIHEYRSCIYSTEDELQNISKQISSNEEGFHNEQELDTCKKRLKEFEDKKKKLNREYGEKDNEKKRYQRAYDSYTSDSDKNTGIKKLVEYAEDIKNTLSKIYEEKQDEIRQKLEKKVNEIFTQMYNGQRRVSIDPKYRIDLLTTLPEGQEISPGESEGTTRVKNFAFIAGLVALAAEKIRDSSSGKDIDLSSEPYPLVMDAPFSNTDETHTANISKTLPVIAEQVIMFVMEKDWKIAKPAINNRIGKTYRLTKISEVYSKINEEK